MISLTSAAASAGQRRTAGGKSFPRGVLAFAAVLVVLVLALWAWAAVVALTSIPAVSSIRALPAASAVPPSSAPAAETGAASNARPATMALPASTESPASTAPDPAQPAASEVQVIGEGGPITAGPRGGPLDTRGRDLYDCADFASWEQVLAVFIASGPGDPNGLASASGAPCPGLIAPSR